MCRADYFKSINTTNSSRAGSNSTVQTCFQMDKHERIACDCLHACCCCILWFLLVVVVVVGQRQAFLKIPLQRLATTTQER